MKQNYFATILMVVTFLWCIPNASSQNSITVKASHELQVAHMDVSPPIRDIKTFTSLKSTYEAKEIKNKFDFKNRSKHKIDINFQDEVVQDYIVSTRATGPTVDRMYEGVSNADNDAVRGGRITPPDTQGDVGPNHYVQMTNLLTKIINLNDNSVDGPFPNSNFWTDFVYDGIDFGASNDGDPIVLYDQFEDRWIVSQFQTDDDYVLIAVSTTPDPGGTYYRYAISYPAFPDYPKFGIWNDAIYITTRDFGGGFLGSTVTGIQKAGLYDGTGAVGFMIPILLSTYDHDGILPADADGTLPPPAGAPHISMFKPWGSHDYLYSAATTPDWSNPTNSTMTITTIPVAAYLSSSGLVYQPNGRGVHAHTWALMYRLQYRNFGTHQSMVANHTVKATPTGSFGIRWYEFRAPATTSSWTTYQQGTFEPGDGDNRWMGSIAMNGQGDIALGYSLSSLSTHPSIRFTGQSAYNSGTGVMDLPETSIYAGTASQNHYRWGDYSMMSVDPVGDEKFWYTTEYAVSTTAWADWATKIAELSLDAADGPAMIAVTPPTLTFTVQPDFTDSDLLNIANIGVAGAEDLNWSLTFAEPLPPPSGSESNAGNNIHIPPAPEGSVMRNNNYEASAGPAPYDGRAIAEQGDLHPMMNATSAVSVYGVRFSPAPAAYSMFDAASPGTYTDISLWPGTAVFTNASEIDINDHNYMYEIDHDGVMRKVNLTDGTFVTLGNVGLEALGMGVDYTTGIYYAIDNYSLYTIDVVNATATLVGGLGAGAGNLMIGMTFDNVGNLYMYDVATDNMWSCNKATGACTLIGSIGFDANFGQGMAWDEVNGQAVLSALNNSTFQAEYRVADLTTGNTAFVGKIGPATELTQFGTICIPAGDAPCSWLTVAPLSGTIAAGTNEDVTISVDATDLAEGTYECELKISSNASNNPLVTIPVTMIVAACEAPTVTTKDITIELDADGNASIVALDILEPTTFTNLTSTANWLGFIGFTENDVFYGDVTAIADVKSTIDAGTDEITLQPNFNSYYPDNFDNPTLQGSTYIEEFGSLAGGASFSFTGNTTSNTLDPRYDAYAFIRIFDAAFDYLGEIRDPLVAGNAFSVQYNNTEPDAYILQYGFTVEGTSGAYEDEASLGNAVVQGMTLNIAPYSSCGLESVVISQTDFDCSNVGPNEVSVTATDINGQVSTGTAEVTLEDNELPVLTVISNPITLWPPNHKYETIDMSQLVVSVDDNCGNLSIDDVYITSVTSDEEEDAKGGGDGKTKDDIVIAADCQSVDLRKERSGKGNGRVYSIFLEVMDENGNAITAKAQVHVPHNNGGTAIDDGMAYEEVCGDKSSFAAFSGDDIELTNYPNPFNGKTTISFTLAESDETTLKVYDTFGKEVATLFNGMAESGQQYMVEFKGEKLSKGIYVYHLQSGNNVSIVKKMILMK